jgi:hypothetical protein
LLESFFCQTEQGLQENRLFKVQAGSLRGKNTLYKKPRKLAVNKIVHVQLLGEGGNVVDAYLGLANCVCSCYSRPFHKHNLT